MSICNDRIQDAMLCGECFGNRLTIYVMCGEYCFGAQLILPNMPRIITCDRFYLINKKFILNLLFMYENCLC